MEIATKDLNIPAHYMDQIPKSKEWKQNYYVDPDLSGSDIECSLWLYMDGSKMEGMAGYGSALFDSEDIILGEDFGGLDTYPIVFQTECRAMPLSVASKNRKTLGGDSR